MRDWQGKRYWIVGASAGLGRAVAQQISQMGAEVILSARSEDALQELAAELPGKSQVLPMDVASDDSVARAFAQAGHIDGIVYLAGVYWPISARDWNADGAVKMLDINLTGAARILGHVVSEMTARDAGHIVLTGSLSGFRGLPGAIGYGASKAGIMSLAESLFADLCDTGIDVQLINPGFVKTRLTEKNDFNMPFIMEPEIAAREFVEHMNDDAFVKSYPRLFAMLFRATRFMPAWLFHRLFKP